MKDKTAIPYKIYLAEDEMPRSWYNVRADMTNKPESRHSPAYDGGGAGPCVLR